MCTTTQNVYSRFLQARVCHVAAIVLALIGVGHFFGYYSEYDYPHIPRDQIPKHLYLEINPKLVVKPNLPPCSYEEVLSKQASLYNWELPSKLDTLSPLGLANGSWSPAECAPRVSVALLVPYRDRQTHLNVFLPYIHHFLRKQNIHYKVYLIEQQDDKPWNKGVLLNTGARVAAADGWPCFILHDVDLLPLDDGNLYSCLQSPRHMSGAVDSLRLSLPYRGLVGGVLAIRADHYSALHGLSELFTGWGGEDDDFHARITRHGLEVLRFGPSLSRYSMLWHRQSSPNPRRHELQAATETANSRRHELQAATETARLPAHTVLRTHPMFTLVGVTT